VFSNGILIGLKELIAIGGQCCPNSILGEILLWKNPQKNETKKNTSDVINKTIPVFSPFITIKECTPCKEASRCTSRHQEYAIIVRNKVATKVNLFLILFIIIIIVNIIDRIPFEAKMGQGLCSTR